MEDSRERVGVYGTLRRGGSQHRRMAGAEWIGACDVRARMYRIDWYPGVVLDDDAGCDWLKAFLEISKNYFVYLGAHSSNVMQVISIYKTPCAHNDI